MPEKYGIPYFSGEDYEYAFDQLDQWFNPKRGLREFSEDPSLLNLVKLTAVPIGYASVAYAVGAEGFLTQHLWIIGREAGVINPVTAAVVGTVTFSYYYGEYVDKPLRNAHRGGAKGLWFGPFASGFGPVV